MRREFSIKPILAGAVIFATQTAATRTVLASDDGGLARITAPLKAAGIRLDDEVGLIIVLRRGADDLGLSAPAAFALGRLPKTDNIVRELNVAATSTNEILVTYAIRALLKLNDNGWVASARERLPAMVDRGCQLYLAQLLARAGVYEGWALVEKAISGQSGGYQELALLDVEAFKPMKMTPDGAPFDLVRKLDSLLDPTPPSNRQAIIDKIKQLTFDPNLKPGVKGYREDPPGQK